MLSVITRLQAAAWRLRAQLRREEGQTSSEYLVIAGVIVLIIITVLGIFRGALMSAIGTIGDQIKGAVAGG